MNRRTSRAFTLIELLVVIAVIAILIGILLPALGEARGTAQQLKSGTIQRQMLIGQVSYSTSNDDFIPGLNTSGFFANRPQDGSSTQSIIDRMETKVVPVQRFDWISPVLGEDALPTDREARFYNILSEFVDPALRQTGVPFPGGDADALQEARDYIEDGGRDQPPLTSFLMQMTWQLYRDQKQSFVNIDGLPGLQVSRYGQLGGSFGFTAGQAELPRSYVPRFTSVGQLSDKIAISDATRYLDTNIADTDWSYFPNVYGSFTTSGPLFEGSTAFGAQTTLTPNGADLGPGNGRQAELTYRHRGRIDAAHWDGSVALYDIVESRNPALWYPSRSIFQGGNRTVAEASFLYGYEEGDKID